MPTLISPANPEQFKLLDKGPILYIGLEVEDVLAKKTFKVDVRIIKLKATPEYIIIKSIYYIPGDQNGTLYGRFFLPHQSTMRVDLKTKRATEFNTFSWYYNDHSKIREIRPITLKSKLSKVVQADGSVEAVTTP